MENKKKKSLRSIIEDIEQNEIVAKFNKIRIGKRMVKTAAAVWLCYIINSLRGDMGIPLNCAIASIMCMQHNIEGTTVAAKNRTVGTLIGVVYGTVVALLYYYGILSGNVFYLALALGILIVIETAILLNHSQLASFSCVTFLSIATIQITVAHPAILILNRIIDMLIGIVVAMAVNSIHLPKKRRTRLLLIADMDKALDGDKNGLTPYCKVQINQMISSGAKLSVSTRNTPGQLRDELRDVEINLPVVVMDGAAIYDIPNHKYLYKARIAENIVWEISRLADERGIICYFGTVVQDVLLIYFKDFSSIAMQEMYRQFRKNPYRNYICAELPENNAHNVLYIQVLDKKEKLKEFSRTIKRKSYFAEIRIKEEPIEGYPDYMYLKIHSLKASRRKTCEKLQKMLETEQMVTFGASRGFYDVITGSGDPNYTVRKIKRVYEAHLWEPETWNAKGR